MARLSFTILFLAIAVALFFTETQPYFNDISALRVEKNKYEEALANSRELQTLKSNLLSQYNAIPQEDVERLNKLLPPVSDSGSLIVMIENMAKARGLLLKKVDVKEEGQSTGSSAVLGAASFSPYKTVNLSFTISGPYASVLNFFADLGKSLRLVDMNAIGFSSAPSDSYEYNISAKTYLVSSASLVAPNATPGEDENIQEILSMLTKLRNIKIDSEFFNSDVFKSLFDFTPTLQLPQQYGRPNPFAPL